MKRIELGQRSTGDLLVMMVAFTVCFSVLATGAAIALIEILHPGANTDGVVGAINDVINTLIGLLAGFLAGRTDVINTQQREALAAEREKKL